MSEEKYNDLINKIKELPSGTKIRITQAWCKNYGLSITAGEAKSFGRRFSQDYMFYKCKHENVSPDQGAASHKKTNNLCCYVKSDF